MIRRPSSPPEGDSTATVTTRETGSVAVRVCSVEGCVRPYSAKGFCAMHYQRWRRTGDPLDAGSGPRPRNTPLEVRLRRRLVEQPNGCIEYMGTRNPKGYGMIGGRNKRGLLAHRVAWELAHGPIPDGLFVCHHCDNPPCCNVGHLFLGTNDDNQADRVAKGRGRLTHCKRGHEFTPETERWTSKGRTCKTCEKLRKRASRDG